MSSEQTNLSSPIALLTMGGTIDKDYFDALSEYKVCDSTLIEDLSNCGLSLSFEQHEICRKDSLELLEADRQALVSKIQSIDNDYILISHGTDTMVETASYLKDNLSEASRQSLKVVLFGAMRPSRFKHSDAHFNFAFALGAIKSVDSGIYIAMSGQIFEPEDVVKNRDAQCFELRQ